MAEMNFDPSAAAEYVAAADSVADVLGTAATHAATAANTPLPGLGLLGQDFATEFAAAIAAIGQTLGVASQLMSTYSGHISTHSTNVVGLDHDISAGLGNLGDSIGGVA